MTSRALNTAYLVMAGAVLLAVGVGVVIVRPQLQTIQETKQAIVTTRQTLQAKQAIVTSLDQKQSQLQVQEQNERILAVALPTNDAMDDVTRIIDRAVTVSGGVVDSISNQSNEQLRNTLADQNQGLGDQRIPANVVPLAAQLKFRGSYAQFRVLLDELEKAPRLMEVTGLTIKRPGTQTLDAVNTDITLRFYRYGS